MSAIDRLLSQIAGAMATSRKEEYIKSTLELLDGLTDNQLEYTYNLIKQLFCQTAD